MEGSEEDRSCGLEGGVVEALMDVFCSRYIHLPISRPNHLLIKSTDLSKKRLESRLVFAL
jgi:hypothetical protein